MPKGRPHKLKPRSRQRERRGRGRPPFSPTLGGDNDSGALTVTAQRRKRTDLSESCHCWGRSWTQTRALDSPSSALPFPGVFPALSPAQGGPPQPQREKPEEDPCLPPCSSLMTWCCPTTDLSPGPRGQPRLLKLASLLPPHTYAQGWTLPSGPRNRGGTGLWKLSAFHRGGKTEAQRAEGIGPGQRDNPQQPQPLLPLPSPSSLGSELSNPFPEDRHKEGDGAQWPTQGLMGAASPTGRSVDPSSPRGRDPLVAVAGKGERLLHAGSFMTSPPLQLATALQRLRPQRTKGSTFRERKGCARGHTAHNRRDGAPTHIGPAPQPGLFLFAFLPWDGRKSHSSPETEPGAEQGLHKYLGHRPGGAAVGSRNCPQPLLGAGS